MTNPYIPFKTYVTFAVFMIMLSIAYTLVLLPVMV